MIEIDEHALNALLSEDPGGPVVMLNLLRFRPDGGRESYQRYAEALSPVVNVRYGLQVDYLGDGGRALVAEAGAGLGHGGFGPLSEPAGVRRHDS
ncbi:hypothetical protein [Amycolatopsis sp. CA-126428]|uniref:hypothetical protein n=1 Tax=Amycolatopsis sp. CA-126428 TaxID=2073158 RepID=UPI001E367976|nr:hypothetical protein [Amycolatopsis sp. CA-126428]